MRINILEKYISPWVLPKETIVSRICWIPSKEIQRIELKCPKEAEIDLPTVETWKQTKEGVAFGIEALELTDKLTFVSKINTVPKEIETKKSFIIRFLDENDNVLSKETLQTRIIRPMLAFENISPRRIQLTKDRLEALVKLELKVLGWGDVRKIRPEIKVDSSFLEIVQFKPTFVTEANPFLDMHIEEYLDRVIAKKAGKTTLSIAFVYEDRIGNVYRTDVNLISISIEKTIGITPEILVENKVSLGDQERIISHPKEARLAWPLQA